MKAIEYCASPASLKILDQLVLPHNMVYIPIETCEQAHAAIKNMNVRGAPAIALVAVLALAVELKQFIGKDTKNWICERLDYLVTSRPTAVNLHDAAQKLKLAVSSCREEDKSIRYSYFAAAERMLKDDVEDNINIGKNGAKFILDHCQSKKHIAVLTICNTGSLATAGYGTAYSVISNLHSSSLLERAYFCETRPYNQGARLTSTELLYDKIPSTMILDSSVAALLGGAKKGQDGKNIKAVIVGADRVARNGDTANKIGTCQLAILAKHFGLLFLVAAPWTTIDLDTYSGTEILVEERAQKEVRHVHGALYHRDGAIKKDSDGIVERGFVEICSEEVDIWNPAFDVTDHSLIDGIVTELGVYTKNGDGEFELVKEKAKIAGKIGSKLDTMTTSNEEHQ